MMVPILILIIALCILSGCLCFTPIPSSTRSLQLNKPTKTLNVIPEAYTHNFEDARGYFNIWFFGGQGGVAVALRQFPAQFSKFQQLFSMSAEEPTAGGETIGISPLCLYPRDLSKADVDKVLNNKLSVEKMVEKGPKVSYMATKGYLCFAAFQEANQNCNPLTTRAVFDALSIGDNVSPFEAQKMLDEFANDTSPDRSKFKSELLRTKLTGFSSIAFLLFLLGPIVGSTCLDALAYGWFPEWPGINNMPWSLIAGPGAWTIPRYWI